MKMTIRYCSQWNYKPQASSLERELKKEMGRDIEVELIAGTGGVFEVVVEGNLIFSKKKMHRFPEKGEISALIGSWITDCYSRWSGPI